MTPFSSTVRVFSPRKSNFTSPAFSTNFMLNCVTGMARARVTVERHQFVKRPVADHDTGRMGRGVAVQSFELECDFKHGRDGFVLTALILQARFDINRLLQRYRVGRIVGDQLAQPVHLAIGHLQHPAHIAHTARACSFPKVMIWATWSAPYLFCT